MFSMPGSDDFGAAWEHGAKTDHGTRYTLAPVSQRAGGRLNVTSVEPVAAATYCFPFTS